MSWDWTKASWREASKENKFWRSSEFNKIETAIGNYDKNSTSNLAKLKALKAILDAISAWRIFKQEAKAKTAKKDFKSPLSDNSKNIKIAAKDTDLKTAGVVAADGDVSVRAKITDKLVQDVVAEIDAVLRVERAKWGNTTFTDPAAHNPNKFCYLVSGQTETAEIVEYREATVKNPALIENAVISASVITQDNCNLWSPSGFILSAPEECIGAGFKGDMAVRNAASRGHELEKYRELLRLYLGEPGSEGRGLPEASSVVRPVGHNEVMVLGRTFGKITTVAAIYVLSDDTAKTDMEATPAALGDKIASFQRGSTITDVIGTRPLVTERRMKQYQDLYTNLRLPILPIPATAAKSLGQKMSDLYTDMGDDGRSLFPIPKNAVAHGSEAHKALEAEVVKKTATRIVRDKTHRCPICTPAR
ncbi:MAG TPA: hypothetical protein VHV55_21460 [Pirellulales bacterium]|jgi:hypothetical protein|nr:hypothetical protein [Pirellulales bacterium]